MVFVVHEKNLMKKTQKPCRILLERYKLIVAVGEKMHDEKNQKPYIFLFERYIFFVVREKKPDE